MQHSPPPLNTKHLFRYAYFSIVALFFLSLTIGTIVAGIEIGLSAAIVFTLIAINIYYYGVSPSRKEHWHQTFSVFTKQPRIYGWALLLLLLEVGFIIAVNPWLPSWMDWSVTGYFFEEQRNVILSPMVISQEALSSGGLSLGIYGFASLFTVSLIGMMPMICYEEERIFRYKRITAGAILLSILSFGLVHFLFAGISLKASLALYILGAGLSVVYYLSFRKQAEEVDYAIATQLDPSLPSIERAHHIATTNATIFHTIHNAYAILILFATLFLL